VVRLKPKVDNKNSNLKNMTTEVLGNYLRAHRRRSGLTQRELGILVGYGEGDQIGLHERSKSEPSLLTALAYEIIFGAPVGQLFTGFRSAVAQAVCRNLEELKAELAAKRRHKPSTEKMQWLENLNIT
jgi:DNA-binding XRE family transcriptional regulator